MKLLIESKPSAIVVPGAKSLTALSSVKSSDNIIPALPMADDAITLALSQEHENALRGLAVSLATASNDAEALAGVTTDFGREVQAENFRAQYLVVFELSKGEGFNVLTNSPELSTAKYAASQAVRDGAYMAIVFPPANEFDYSQVAQGFRPEPLYQVVQKGIDGKPDMPAPIPAWKKEQDRIRAQERKIRGIVAAKRAPLTQEQRETRAENKVLAAASRREALLQKAGR
jgi:hypothetical protein